MSCTYSDEILFFQQGKSKRHIDDPECHGGKKSIFLTLPFKASSSSYSKGIVYVISAIWKCQVTHRNFQVFIDCNTSL